MYNLFSKNIQFVNQTIDFFRNAKKSDVLLIKFIV